MKAWTVDNGDEWCLVVFAETRNRARLLAHCGGPVDMDYIDCRAQRLPTYDQYATGELVAVVNEDLPQGAPDFWSDTGPAGDWE